MPRDLIVEDDRMKKALIWMRKQVVRNPTWTLSFKHIDQICERFKILPSSTMDLYEQVKDEKWGFPRKCRKT